MCLSSILEGVHINIAALSHVLLSWIGGWIAATVQAAAVVGDFFVDLADDEGTVAAIFPCTLHVYPAFSKPLSLQRLLLEPVGCWLSADAILAPYFEQSHTFDNDECITILQGAVLERQAKKK